MSTNSPVRFAAFATLMLVTFTTACSSDPTGVSLNCATDAATFESTCEATQSVSEAAEGVSYEPEI
jgi:hypothetical protein